MLPECVNFRIATPKRVGGGGGNFNAFEKAFKYQRKKKMKRGRNRGKGIGLRKNLEFYGALNTPVRSI